MLEHEIEAFGRRLGLDSLAFSPDGLVRLDIGTIGSFHLEKAEHDGRHELLVYLSAPLPDHDADAARRLLSLCDYRRGLPMPLFSGVFSGRGILLVRIPEDKVTAAGLENTLRYLADLMQQA